MAISLLQVLGLLALAAPVWAACLAACHSVRPRTRASDLALAAGVGAPVALVLLTAAVGVAPWSRPLDQALWWQVGLSAVCGWACVGRRGGRAHLGAALARIGRAWRSAWRSASGAQRLLIACGLSAHAGVALTGTWVFTNLTDELAYHLPQAQQIVQDGRLGAVHAGVVWADSYPRGAAILWAWSACVSGTDAAYRPLNAAWGLLLALATGVAARRVGAARSWSLALGACVLTTPVVATLSMVVYADMAAGALVAVAVAAALPRRGKAARTDGLSLVVCAAASAAALWCKVTVAPALAAVWAFRFCAAACVWARHRGGEGQLWATVAASAAAALAAAPPYVVAWVKYASPVYPLRVALGPWVVFEGPMTVESLGWERAWGWATRLRAFWFTFDPHLDPEGKGQLGPVWAFALVGCVAVMALGQVARPRWGQVMLCVLCGLLLVVPNYHWARYAVWALAPAGAAAAWLATRVHDRGAGAGVALALLGLGALGQGQFWSGLTAHLAPTLAAAEGVPLAGPQRLAWAWWVRGPRADAGPTAETRRALLTRLRPGERVLSTLACRPWWVAPPGGGQVVEVRPARPWPDFDYGFNPVAALDWSAGETERWRAHVRATAPEWVLVYAGQAEESALEGLGYRLAVEQTAGAGVPAIRVYERAGVSGGESNP